MDLFNPFLVRPFTLDFQSSPEVHSTVTVTFNDYVIEGLDRLIAHPYNYVEPYLYAETIYDLMNDSRFNYSTTTLFQMILNLTFAQRMSLLEYFKHRGCEPFVVTMNEDVWNCYLTTNNNELFNKYFGDSDTTITIEFEGIKGV